MGGAWESPGAREELVTRNPATGEELARVPLSSADDVARAVAAARAAQPGWAATPITVRARALMDLRTSLVAHQDELARLLATDMGKTIPDASAEVGRGIESVEAAIAAPHLLKGQVLEGVSRGIDVEMVHQPVGVIGVITPFNFPVMLPLWFIPFALACGNAVVLKPSEQDPLCPERIVELISEIDAIPPGLVNLVHGAHDAVNALLDSEGVDAISFVGSAATARYVASRAIATGKRVQALGGAKNSMIVAPDADRKLMVSGVLSSAFGGAGQRCLAGSVAVLVGTAEEQDAALGAIVDGARALKVGGGLDESTDVCPVVSPAVRERLEGDIAQAEEEGARVLLDGRGDAGAGGCQLGPTVLDLADTESRAAREELFGPVLSVVRVPDLDAAIDWSNGSTYGNSAILFTVLRWRGAAVPPADRGRDARREHRGRRPGRLVPLRRLEGLDGRRPPRQRRRRLHLLHPPEGGDLAMGMTRTHEELQELGYDHLLQQFARNGAFAPGGALELPVLVRGEGACRVTDTRGVEHLDALSGMFCMQLGYGHGEEIAEAAAEQLRTMPYTTNWSTATPTAIELATELARRAPGDISHAFFCGGGSEAVESAWKIVRQHFVQKGEPHRHKVIARRVAYHGVNLGALAISGVATYKAPFGPPALEVRHVATTNRYRQPDGDDDAAFSARLLAEIEAVSRRRAPRPSR